MRVPIVNDLNNLPKFVCWPGTSNNHTGHIIHVIQKKVYFEIKFYTVQCTQ